MPKFNPKIIILNRSASIVKDMTEEIKKLGSKSIKDDGVEN